MTQTYCVPPPYLFSQQSSNCIYKNLLPHDANKPIVPLVAACCPGLLFWPIIFKGMFYKGVVLKNVP